MEGEKIGGHTGGKKWKDTPDTHIIWQQTGKSVRKADSNSSSDAHSVFLFVPLTYMIEV